MFKIDAKVSNIVDKIKLINNKYPSINYGGCGTFSYYLNKVLKDKYNLDSEIVYIKSDSPPGLMPDYDISFSHIMVKVNDYYIDNNGVYKNCIVEKLDINKLKEMISIPQLWNNVYNHSQTSELIKDLYLLLLKKN